LPTKADEGELPCGPVEADVFALDPRLSRLLFPRNMGTHTYFRIRISARAKIEPYLAVVEAALAALSPP
jgi:hypothetical protein